jgi:hypothetical protein
MTPMDDVDEQLEVDAETAANLIAILGIKKPAIFDRLNLGRKTPREIAAIASYSNSPEHAVAIHAQPAAIASRWHWHPRNVCRRRYFDAPATHLADQAPSASESQ